MVFGSGLKIWDIDEEIKNFEYILEWFVFYIKLFKERVWEFEVKDEENVFKEWFYWIVENYFRIY